MPIEKENFRSYTLQDDKKPKHKIQSLRMSESEYELFELCGKLLEEEKLSTTIKTLAKLGAYALQEGLSGQICQSLFKKRRQNKRLGILLESFED